MAMKLSRELRDHRVTFGALLLVAAIGSTACDRDPRENDAPAEDTARSTEDLSQPANPGTAPAGDLPESLTCNGNEPSWRLDLDGPQGRLHRLGSEPETPDR